MRTNKYIKITNLESILYEFIESCESKPRERRRAMAILMNNDKKSVLEIAQKMGMHPDTVYDWLIKFMNEGIEGIKDKPITGRPKILKTEDKETIKEVFKKSA